MATFTETETETEMEVTPLLGVVQAPDATDPRAASAAVVGVAAASSVVPTPDAVDPGAAAVAAASVNTEEFPCNMIDLKAKMIGLGLIPPSRPPPKQWFRRLAGWFPGLTGWFPRLERLWRQSLADIRRGREEWAADRQLVTECLEHYNRRHPGDEYEPLLGNVTQNPHLDGHICWVHGNFVARKKGSGVFSFLTAPRSVFFFELAYMDGFEGVVTCTTVEDGYTVLGYPLWWATRTSGILDSFCKTCYCRFGIPRPGVQKIYACGHNNVAEVCEMCYCLSPTLHPDPGEFAFGYRHPCHPYPKC